MFKIHYLTRFACCAAILFIPGCSEKTTTYHIAGQVLIDGKPVPGGTIQFVPESGRPIASRISQEGYFSLADDLAGIDKKPGGIPAGNYRLGISSMEVIDEDQGKVDQHIPTRYADFRKSELTVEVKGEDRNMLIELTWDGADAPEQKKTPADLSDSSEGDPQTKEGKQE